MKKKFWKSFSWDLSRVPDQEPDAVPPFHMREALPEEETKVLDVVSKSIAFDSSLGEAASLLQRYWIELAPRIRGHKDHHSLCVFHGERMIAASVFQSSADADFQLVTGPCVLAEYGSRGIGLWLLQATLFSLKSKGLQNAVGICKEHSILSKYLYPKFGGQPQPCEFQILQD